MENAVKEFVFQGRFIGRKVVVVQENLSAWYGEYIDQYGDWILLNEANSIQVVRDQSSYWELVSFIRIGEMRGNHGINMSATVHEVSVNGNLIIPCHYKALEKIEKIKTDLYGVEQK